jgi:hypothetical protein
MNGMIKPTGADRTELRTCDELTAKQTSGSEVGNAIYRITRSLQHKDLSELEAIERGITGPSAPQTPVDVSARAIEMRNAIDVMEGALMRWPKLMDLPEKWATHGAERHRRELGLRHIEGNCGQLYDVYDALAELTRIVNSLEFSEEALSVSKAAP